MSLPFPAIDPVIISIGPLSIRWYGLAYLLGIVLGWIYILRLLKQDTLWREGQKKPTAQDIGDFLLWAVIGIIVGGRLGNVLFYDPQYYFAHPGEIFAIWKGGMAFHGGLLGVIIALVGFALIRKLPLLTLCDLVSAAAPIGLFLGRIANFINGELWGRPTDMPWGMVFPMAMDGLARHPSQLYEAGLEGLFLFLSLRFLTHTQQRLKTPGFVAGAFVAGYGAIRIVMEFFRTPEGVVPILGLDLTKGMALSLPMLIGGLCLIGIAKGLSQKK